MTQLTLFAPHYLLADESPAGSIRYGGKTYEPYASRTSPPDLGDARAHAVCFQKYPRGELVMVLKMVRGRWKNLVGGW